MGGEQQNYEFIKTKIQALKQNYPSLVNKSDDYVFSVLAIKSTFYKNPALTFNDSDIQDMVVDGKNDGGVDALLADPSSEASDLVLVQSKFYENIDKETVANAMHKLSDFYINMNQGHYEGVNDKVQKRFLTLNSDVGEESKIHFVFYTSAQQRNIRTNKIVKDIREKFKNNENILFDFYFAQDVVEEIKESESRRETVESGKLKIDIANNYLCYGDLEDPSSIVVNASAFSIKKLYAQYSTSLLSKNLRYHVTNRSIDKAIKETIEKEPSSFWFKNNGITIICDEFEVDSKEVKLKNFSIINGGQTTYLLHKSKEIDEHNDFYLPCKIIKVLGESQDDKSDFILEIAKATNSQKPIKSIDLKANAKEQVRFANTMREVGVFYQTKRGETVPRQFKDPYLNTDLNETGKLCLASIFQKPCASRNKPSTIYVDKYYNVIFNGDQKKIAEMTKQLLYIDYYFKKQFIKTFDNKNADYRELIEFAHNSRTLCIAFVSIAARIKQKNILIKDLLNLLNKVDSDELFENDSYQLFRNLDDFKWIIPEKIFSNKDYCDAFLYKIFEEIIIAGSQMLSIEKDHDATLNPSNYLKKDKNYYKILKSNLRILSEKIDYIYEKFTNI